MIARTGTAGCRLRLVAVLISGCLLAGVLLNGQGSATNIQGVVTDSSGATIADAAITVRNVGTGISQTVQTNGQGRYLIPELAVGDYEITATKTGFNTVVRRGITLTVGADAVIDIALSVGQQTQTVTVEGQISQVETTNASVSSLVDTQQMRELPLNGRNWEQLLLLGAGVQSYTSTLSTAFTGRAPSYSIAGGRPEGQALLLDDENLQNFWNRGLASVTGSSLGIEAIGEFQTLTNTYSAQFGGNGGVVNAVSKSGTNAFHGSAFDFLRNSRLDARNFFESFRQPGASSADPAPFRRNQFGGAVGGRVVKDKAFFFVNYEGIRQLLGETKTGFFPDATHRTPTATDPATAAAIASTIALYPLPDPNTVTASGIGTAFEVGSQIAHDNYLLARFDYNLGSKDSMFLRYVQSKTYFLEPFAGSGGTAPGAVTIWPEEDHSLLQFSTFEWRHILSPTIVNVARVSFSRPTTDAITTNSVPALQFFPGAGRQDGGVTITGLTGIGGNTFVPFNLIQNRFTEADDLLITHGSHSIRFGISISRLQSNTNDLFRVGGVYSFQSLQNFLAGTALTFTGVPATSSTYSHRDWRHTEITPYAQDDWKVTKRLTLNLGVRWDFMTNPYDTHNALTTITDFKTATAFTTVPNVFKDNPTWTAIDPRVGLAFDPFSDHKTSIRAGFGLFHNPILPAVYSAGFWSNPPYSTFQINNPSYPFAFAGAANLTPPLPTSSPGFDYYTNTTPYMMQYNLNVQREVAGGAVLTLGYVGSKGIHLFTQREQNPPIPTFDSNGVMHFGSFSAGRVVPNPRLNPNLSIFPDFGTISSSHYNSLQASLNKRFARNYQLQASYTYSRCIDDGSTFASLNSNSAGTIENPYNQKIDVGRCSFDIQHTLRVNGLISLPFHGNRFVEGWQLSGIESASSGLPFNISNGFDIAGYQTSGTPRPDAIAGCDPNNAPHTAQQWFNPGCFTVPAVGTLGNVGRLTGVGPNFVNTDLAVLKDTKITEQVRVQFRAEFFNIFNHTNFALPTAAIFTAAPATSCTASGLGCGNLNPQAGTITSIAGTSRQIQFGLKILF